MALVDVELDLAAFVVDEGDVAVGLVEDVSFLLQTRSRSSRMIDVSDPFLRVGRPRAA